jgi:DNA-binding PadR family transcriptional regulator
MYELFILSKLMHRPMHGYLIHAILNSAVGPFRQVSWGTLYPLMKKLENSGLIVAVDEEAEDARGKKRYRTTEAGRRRLFELLSRRGDFDSDSPDLFSLKVGCFGHLDLEERQLVLKDYRDYAARVLAHSEEMTARVEGETNLPAEERRFALLALDHKRAVAEAELHWIDALLKKPRSLASKPVKTKAGSGRDRK